MAVLCGHCKNHHEHVQEVYNCSLDLRLPTPGRAATQPPARPVSLSEKKPQPRVTEDGMYIRDSVVYKVQRAVHGNGHLYAKRLEIEEGTKNGHFEYAPGAISLLRPWHKMTLAEAQKFGRLYGVCCKCGRMLTDEGSIEAGIGPVCAGKGW